MFRIDRGKNNDLPLGALKGVDGPDSDSCFLACIDPNLQAGGADFRNLPAEPRGGRWLVGGARAISVVRTSFF